MAILRPFDPYVEGVKKEPKPYRKPLKNFYIGLYSREVKAIGKVDARLREALEEYANNITIDDVERYISIHDYRDVYYSDFTFDGINPTEVKEDYAIYYALLENGYTRTLIGMKDMRLIPRDIPEVRKTYKDVTIGEVLGYPDDHIFAEYVGADIDELEVGQTKIKVLQYGYREESRYLDPQKRLDCNGEKECRNMVKDKPFAENLYLFSSVDESSYTSIVIEPIEFEAPYINLYPQEKKIVVETPDIVRELRRYHRDLI